MSSRAVETRALSAIAAHGALLVYPITNQKAPRSLWSELYPRSRMTWAWDDGADDRVVGLWHTREQLAQSREVVYTRWYRGRASFFSRDLFTAMLAALAPWDASPSGEAREILAVLEESSPQSTRVVRREAGLRGKEGERVWQRSMRELWDALLVVGTGEVDDGAFPSLAVGATQLIFEELWDRARLQDRSAAIDIVTARLAPEPTFLRYFKQLVARD